MVITTLSKLVFHVFHSKWHIVHHLCVSYLELGPVIILALRKWCIYYFWMVFTETHTERETALVGFYFWASSVQNFIYWSWMLLLFNSNKVSQIWTSSLQVPSFCVRPPPIFIRLSWSEARLCETSLPPRPPCCVWGPWAVPRAAAPWRPLLGSRDEMPASQQPDKPPLRCCCCCSGWF